MNDDPQNLPRIPVQWFKHPFDNQLYITIDSICNLLERSAQLHDPNLTESVQNTYLNLVKYFQNNKKIIEGDIILNQLTKEED